MTAGDGALTVTGLSFPGEVVQLVATTSDLCDPDPSLSGDAPARFPLGVTVVTWVSIDASGNKATATTRVTVAEVAADEDAITVTPSAAPRERPRRPCSRGRGDGPRRRGSALSAPHPP